GYDVSRYVLNCFGGAGGQHACMVADALGMREVFIHPMSSLLSAYGMGLAGVSALRNGVVERALDDSGLAQGRRLAQSLQKDCVRDLTAQGVPAGDIRTAFEIYLRFAGTDAPLNIIWRMDAGVSGLRRAFALAHRKRFGFSETRKDIVIESIAVEASAAGAPVAMKQKKLSQRRLPAPDVSTRFFSAGKWRKAGLWKRENIPAGRRIAGPALIIEPHQTIVVEPGWHAKVTAQDCVVLKRAKSAERKSISVRKADPVLVEVFNNRFMSIAEQMGVTLQNTASSVNIKERLDFSCAIFDPQGALVANAPHIPVHLGSMDASVETVIRSNLDSIHPGDAFALNAPYNGGTHLPDITVCTPVFDDEKKKILFWTASRGHHADIGGITPGSMTPRAMHIEEEGVYIDNFRIVARGVFQAAGLERLLTSAKHPVRNFAMNIGDLRAQIAANARGAELLQQFSDEVSLPVMHAYMGHVQDNGEASVRRLIDRLKSGAFCVELDQGLRICGRVKVQRKMREAVIDFTGTSPQSDGNFNAPAPIARAVVLYVLRVLAGGSMPMNAGCLRPVRIVLPHGSLLSPQYPAAVVAGNVETSQNIADCLFAALDALSSSQGTMNNFTFGNSRYQYYETICSGAPAGQGFHGAAAVQTHMTNSRLTDPEILELRFPVMVEDFHIRRGSGGRGQWNGGDGVSRTIRFLEDMDAAILSSRRRIRPFGMHGGHEGACGRNLLLKKDGEIVELEGCAQFSVRAGEAVRIETPSGGGWGNSAAKGKG
ncbi:MAG: 5-oxoprolinase, partial [Alphaproteobacteria bacterium]|nr:5-oxoprolinase [Alphaproteobacteria bacterium]